MKFNEFIEFLNKNLNSKNTFLEKATEFQNEKNKKRTPAKRWNDVKIERAVDKMWTELAKNVYNKVKPGVTVKSYDANGSWIEYLEKNEVLENIDDMIVDLEFE